MSSAAERIYWLGFAVALKRSMMLRGHSASVLARLVEADGDEVPDDRFQMISRLDVQLLSRSSIRPAVHFAREALADCGLGAKITCRRTRGEGVAFYALDGSSAVRAFVEAWV